MKRSKNLRIVLAFCTWPLICGSCKPVKPYQRIYLNDRDMQIGGNGASDFETSIFTYREGASGAESSKSSGGCGCN